MIECVFIKYSTFTEWIKCLRFKGVGVGGQARGWRGQDHKTHKTGHKRTKFGRPNLKTPSSNSAILAHNDI